MAHFTHFIFHYHVSLKFWIMVPQLDCKHLPWGFCFTNFLFFNFNSQQNFVHLTRSQENIWFSLSNPTLLYLMIQWDIFPEHHCKCVAHWWQGNDCIFGCADRWSALRTCHICYQLIVNNLIPCACLCFRYMEEEVPAQRCLSLHVPNHILSFVVSNRAQQGNFAPNGKLGRKETHHAFACDADQWSISQGIYFPLGSHCN